MITVLVLVVGAALLVGAVVALGPLIRRAALSAASRVEHQPIPSPWLRVVTERVPAIRSLNAEQQNRLLRAARDLMQHCHWEGLRGLVLTEDMQLVIAAQACLLTLELPGDPYPGLRAVLVYPGTFQPHPDADPRKWVVDRAATEPPSPELGEAWRDGTVVVSWGAAETGGRNPTDGRNVVFHEFAHLLDYQYALEQGDPNLSYVRNDAAGSGAEMSTPRPGRWSRVLGESYERHCAAVAVGAPTLLGEYAATSVAEFLAVATERFFERPGELREEYPDLYQQLSGFFRQDPARRAE